MGAANAWTQASVYAINANIRNVYRISLTIRFNFWPIVCAWNGYICAYVNGIAEMPLRSHHSHNTFHKPTVLLQYSPGLGSGRCFTASPCLQFGIFLSIFVCQLRRPNRRSVHALVVRNVMNAVNRRTTVGSGWTGNFFSPFLSFTTSFLASLAWIHIGNVHQRPCSRMEPQLRVRIQNTLIETTPWLWLWPWWLLNGRLFLAASSSLFFLGVVCCCSSVPSPLFHGSVFTCVRRYCPAMNSRVRDFFLVVLLCTTIFNIRFFIFIIHISRRSTTNDLRLVCVRVRPRALFVYTRIRNVFAFHKLFCMLCECHQSLEKETEQMTARAPKRDEKTTRWTRRWREMTNTKKRKKNREKKERKPKRIEFLWLLFASANYRAIFCWLRRIYCLRQAAQPFTTDPSIAHHSNSSSSSNISVYCILP